MPRCWNITTGQEIPAKENQKELHSENMNFDKLKKAPKETDKTMSDILDDPIDKGI